MATTSTDGLALRLMTSAWCSRHIPGDLLLATISEWFTWTILARCFISFVFVSLWILNSLTYSLNTYDLRLVTAFNTSLTRLIRKLTAYAQQLSQCFSLTITVLLSFGVIWPTSLLRAYCYSIPLSQRTAYLDGSAAGIRCDRDSFYSLYRRLGRLAIASTLRLLSRTSVALIISLMLVYMSLVLHAIWVSLNSFLDFSMTNCVTDHILCPLLCSILCSRPRGVATIHVLINDSCSLVLGMFTAASILLLLI